jgi:hypothetical protein
MRVVRNVNAFEKRSQIKTDPDAVRIRVRWSAGVEGESPGAMGFDKALAFGFCVALGECSFVERLGADAEAG